MKNILQKVTRMIIFAGTMITLVACDPEPTKIVEFGFEENLASKFGDEVVIDFSVFAKDIKQIDLTLDGEIVQTWNNPKEGKLSTKLNMSKVGIGAKKIALIATLKNGEKRSEDRLIRVLSDIVPEKWEFEVVGTYPHNYFNFTQGFEFHDGKLYESTGQQGESKVAIIDLQTGKDINKNALDATHFGEGITILNDTIYQLTWQTHKCFMYNANTLEILLKDHTYQGEGWGICNDGQYLIMSDGTERLYFRDPKTFEIVKTIEVYTNQQPVVYLNELEYINGFIFANIWMTSNIAIIEPETGRVIGVLDCAQLTTSGRGTYGEAFNGIAYNKQENALYVTGKLWEKTFKIRVPRLNTPV